MKVGSLVVRHKNPKSSIWKAAKKSYGFEDDTTFTVTKIIGNKVWLNGMFEAFNSDNFTLVKPPHPLDEFM